MNCKFFIVNWCSLQSFDFMTWRRPQLELRFFTVYVRRSVSVSSFFDNLFPQRFRFIMFSLFLFRLVS